MGSWVGLILGIRWPGVVFMERHFALRWERRIREIGPYIYASVGEGTVKRYLGGYTKTDCTRRVYFIVSFGVLVGGTLHLSSGSTREFEIMFLTCVHVVLSDGESSERLFTRLKEGVTSRDV